MFSLLVVPSLVLPRQVIVMYPKNERDYSLSIKQ